MQVHFGLCFNPRARVGRDLRVRMSSVKTCWRFNPRARVGRDVTLQGVTIERKQVSIHAPAWGATARAHVIGQDMLAFQSTRPRGARPYAYNLARKTAKFQSTRPRGARRFASTN